MEKPNYLDYLQSYKSQNELNMNELNAFKYLRAYALIEESLPHEFLTHFVYFGDEQFTLTDALMTALHNLPGCFSDQFLAEKIDDMFKHYKWMKHIYQYFICFKNVEPNAKEKNCALCLLDQIKLCTECKITNELRTRLALDQNL